MYFISEQQLILFISPFHNPPCPFWPWRLTLWCRLISGTWGASHHELLRLCFLYLSICTLNWAKEQEPPCHHQYCLPCPRCIVAILSPNDQLPPPSHDSSSCLLVLERVWSVQTAIVPYKSMGCLLCLFTKVCPLCRCGTLSMQSSDLQGLDAQSPSVGLLKW